jgi:hypothetical protein
MVAGRLSDRSRMTAQSSRRVDRGLETPPSSSATPRVLIERRTTMNPPSARSGLQLRSTIKRSGELELSLVDTPVPEPAPDEVVIRVEAAPINPSDIGLLFGAADMSTATPRAAPTGRSSPRKCPTS